LLAQLESAKKTFMLKSTSGRILDLQNLNVNTNSVQDGGHMDLETMSSGFLEDEIMQDLTSFQASSSQLFPG
jgi:hypothetical protein